MCESDGQCVKVGGICVLNVLALLGTLAIAALVVGLVIA